MTIAANAEALDQAAIQLHLEVATTAQLVLLAAAPVHLAHTEDTL
jgi:hypothetical protein